MENLEKIEQQIRELRKQRSELVNKNRFAGIYKRLRKATISSQFKGKDAEKKAQLRQVLYDFAESLNGDE